jgi:hypothetical protein
VFESRLQSAIIIFFSGAVSLNGAAVGYTKTCVYGYKIQQFWCTKIRWIQFTKGNKNEVIGTFVEGSKGGAIQ